MVTQSIKKYNIPFSVTFMTSLFSIHAFAYDTADKSSLTHFKAYTQVDASLSNRSARHGQVNIYDKDHQESDKAEDMKSKVASFTVKAGIKDMSTRMRYEVALTHYNKLFDSFFDAVEEGFIDESRKLASDMLMFNIAYDYPLSDKFFIYPLLGVGISVNHFKGVMTSFDKDKKMINSESKHHRRAVFAWQLGAGATYEVSDNVAVDLSYRYVDLGRSTLDYKTDNLLFNIKTSLYSSDISLGIRYTF